MSYWHVNIKSILILNFFATKLTKYRICISVLVDVMLLKFLYTRTFNGFITQFASVTATFNMSEIGLYSIWN